MFVSVSTELKTEPNMEYLQMERNTRNITKVASRSVFITSTVLSIFCLLSGNILSNTFRQYSFYVPSTILFGLCSVYFLTVFHLRFRLCTDYLLPQTILASV